MRQAISVFTNRKPGRFRPVFFLLGSFVFLAGFFAIPAGRPLSAYGQKLPEAGTKSKDQGNYLLNRVRVIAPDNRSKPETGGPVRIKTYEKAGSKESEASAVLKRPSYQLARDWQANLEKGRQLEREGKIEEAITVLEKAAEGNPANLEINRSLARLYHLQDDYVRAIKHYEQVLYLTKWMDAKALTDAATAYRDIALKSSGSEQAAYFAKSTELYRTALKVEPNLAEAHNNYGFLLFSTGKLQQAEQEVRQAILLKPYYPVAFFYLADIYRAQGRIPEACIAYYHSLLQETNQTYLQDTRARIVSLGIPENCLDFFCRGYEAALINNVQNCRKEFSACAESAGSARAIACNNIGYTYLLEEKPQEALKWFNTSLASQTEKQVPALYNAALALTQSGHYAQAGTLLHEAIKLRGSTPALCQNLLGVLASRAGNMPKALSAYKLAILQSGDTLPIAHLNMALALERLNRPAEAGKEYNAYLKQAPHGANAGFVQKRLEKLKVK